MSTSFGAVDLPLMAKQESASKQINVRVRRDRYAQYEALRQSLPYSPTWTQIFDRLLAQWFDENRDSTGAIPAQRPVKGGGGRKQGA